MQFLRSLFVLSVIFLQVCIGAAEDMDYMCRAESSTAVCSGNGQCEEGQCICQPNFAGRYCECNDRSCPRLEGVMCGGAARGRCSCGICACTRDFTGENCGCTLSETTCRASNGKICNDQGNCRCGQCVCENNFRGPTCEECPTCPNSRRAADNRCQKSKNRCIKKMRRCGWDLAFTDRD